MMISMPCGTYIEQDHVTAADLISKETSEAIHGDIMFQDLAVTVDGSPASSVE